MSVLQAQISRCQSTQGFESLQLKTMLDTQAAMPFRSPYAVAFWRCRWVNNLRYDMIWCHSVSLLDNLLHVVHPMLLHKNPVALLFSWRQIYTSEHAASAYSAGAQKPAACNPLALFVCTI